MCVVGSGMRFLSGISYYTLRLSNALAVSCDVSVVLMRRLLPAHIYPGRGRVGLELTRAKYAPSIRVFDGVDWYWLPSIVRALKFLVSQRPDFVVFEWWSGTVLHSYSVLAIAARCLGARIVIEFHELLDVGEMRFPAARAYVGLLAPFLIRMASALVVHSEHDRRALKEQYRLRDRKVALIPHGPYDHYQLADEQQSLRTASVACCNLLYFGVIRPFKGLEDLISAFDSIPEARIQDYWLTVVGETWEGWTLPSELMGRSRYRDRITFVNRYVRDEEVAAYFAGADAVVLPYHRSSASGPLHVAMSWGLPVIVTEVGGLPEAVARYEGAILVKPRDPEGIRVAIEQVVKWKGRCFDDPHSWERSVERYGQLLAQIDDGNPLT